MFKKRHPKVGARPGTLVIAADSPPPTIHVISYSQEEVHEEDITDPAALKQAFDDQNMTWIDVQGFGDESVIRKIAEVFSIHPLAIEDVVNFPHRPAAQVFCDEQLLLITRMVSLDGPQQIEMEQLSILVGKHYVITFQERPGDILEPIRKRIRSGKNPIRHQGAGFLAYAILDTTFMAGVYGMNFEAMPELKFKWSYPLLWLVMFSTAVGMLIYFRRLGWIGRSSTVDEDTEED